MGLFSSIGKIVGGIGKIAGPVTSVLTGNPWIGSAISAGSQFLASRSSAKDQMAFQERMSNTSHRREMADLKAAGLNPILSAKYGGASTPSGAGYSAPSLSDAASSAASVPVKAATVRNLIEQNNNLQTNSALQRAQATKIQLENDAFATLSPTLRAIVLSGGGAASAAAAAASSLKAGARGTTMLKNAFPFFKRDGSQPLKWKK